MKASMPRQPIYVISKGRADCCFTSRFLQADGVPHRVVVEPQEAEEYAKTVGSERLLLLPFSNLGQGSIPARNWCWEHAKAAGHDWHWILDDNIRGVYRVWRRKRLHCNSAPALRATEDFIDRYEDVALGGLAYHMFALPEVQRMPPFRVNCHVYSCILIRNDIPHRWRGRYNEDTDLCLQVLSAGMFIIQVNAFTVRKCPTMTMKGGNTTDLYKGDGRLRMARSLERMWPGIVTTTRHWQRPQHCVPWRKFNAPLRLKPGIMLKDGVDEYGFRLVQKAPIRSTELARLVADRLKKDRV